MTKKLLSVRFEDTVGGREYWGGGGRCGGWRPSELWEWTLGSGSPSQEGVGEGLVW